MKSRGSEVSQVKVQAIADTHLHLREGAKLVKDLIAASAQGGADFAIFMPNTQAGLKNGVEAERYYKVARNADREGKLDLRATFVITPDTTFETLKNCVQCGVRDAKVYPRGRTTNSSYGVSDYGALLPIIKRCGEMGIRVHFHPEHPIGLVPNRDAEYLFIPIMDMFLRETKATLIWEHGTDGRCVPFWEEWGEKEKGRFAVTLTAHHLLTTEDVVFGDVRGVCKPPIKTEADRFRLIDLVAAGYSWVMAGSDSAPHPVHKKNVQQGRCACGAFTAPFLHSLYAQALGDILFDTETGINLYNAFVSENARKFYDWPASSREIVLINEPFTIPNSYLLGGEEYELFMAGEMLRWSIAK